MARLPEQLGDLLARVEILARGAERRRADAARALVEGRPARARSEALAILDELPRSRVALLLWADAAEAMLLDGEAAEALERLAREVPFRADVWLRLAEARHRAGDDPASALLRAAEAADPSGAADRARLWLADLDLLRGDPARAERWLEQLGLPARASADATLRRVEAWLDQGNVERARRAAAALPAPPPLDARGWLVEGRLAATAGGAAAAFERALLLDAPRSGRVVADFVAACRDADALARLSRTVAELGYADHPSWRAAFAIADGRTADAVRALADGARRDPAPGLLERYIAAVLVARDPAALADAVALAGERSAPLEPGVVAVERALTEEAPLARVAALDAATGAARDWAAALRRDAYARLLPGAAPAAWREIDGELAALARALSVIDVLPDIESIAVDLDRPLRVAVVGEFNAGKSSFINALLGEAVAPVGVLPTTATVNHLVWAPDRFARVQRPDADRVVPHAALRDTLRELDPASVERVTIYAPLELLRRVELIDTPGFNAPEPEHVRSARSVFSDAHVVVWLLDATQPLKQSERAVMEQIRDLDLPLVVLVNKIDRLPDVAAVDATLAHVASGLAGAGIDVEVPPLAFSARLALEGRADAAAFERSRWQSVERLVEDLVFAESGRLREGALRRRAWRVARALATEVRARAGVREREAAERAARDARLGEVAADARGRAEELERALERTIDAELDALAPDLRPVSGGDIDDDALADFVVARLRGPLAAAATRQIVEVVTGAERSAIARALEPRVEAMVAALAPWLYAGGVHRTSATHRLARQVVVELGRVILAAVGAPPPAGEDPAGARTLALVAALETSVMGGVNLPGAPDVG